MFYTIRRSRIHGLKWQVAGILSAYLISGLLLLSKLGDRNGVGSGPLAISAVFPGALILVFSMVHELLEVFPRWRAKETYAALRPRELRETVLGLFLYLFWVSLVQLVFLFGLYPFLRLLEEGSLAAFSRGFAEYGDWPFGVVFLAVLVQVAFCLSLLLLLQILRALWLQRRGKASKSPGLERFLELVGFALAWLAGRAFHQALFRALPLFLEPRPFYLRSSFPVAVDGLNGLCWSLVNLQSMGVWAGWFFPSLLSLVAFSVLNLSLSIALAEDRLDW